MSQKAKEESRKNEDPINIKTTLQHPTEDSAREIDTET